MQHAHKSMKPTVNPPATDVAADALHPAWREFVRYCVWLKHGEIEKLKIQDGLPVLAEVIKKKVRFAS
jgi:hypothetical protein